MFNKVPLTPGHLMISILLLFETFPVVAQVPVVVFDREKYDSVYYCKFAVNKTIPHNISQQALTALSFYPELTDKNIVFRFRKRKSPLTARPSLKNIFLKNKNRITLITISTSVNKRLAPVLFSNLPYDAQIGVLGHELSHALYFSGQTLSGMAGMAFNHFSGKYKDKMEYKTDSVCIIHGLGFQLLSWSNYVRSALNIDQWTGHKNREGRGKSKISHERYMNPGSIKRVIAKTPLYSAMKNEH